MDRALRYFSIITAFILLDVVIMGSTVTNTGSANGCGANWPLCYGHVIPTSANAQTWIEFSHRAVSGLAGILVLIQAIWIIIRMRKVKETTFLAISSVIFIIMQALLGAAAVLWGQSSVVLALHFGISLLSFASVLLITVLVYEHTLHEKRIVPKISNGFLWNTILLSIYTYIVIYSGAFVRHTDSSLGCTDFPLCNGHVIPDLYSRAGIQYIHRTLAMLILVWLIITLIVTMKKYRNQRMISINVLLSLIFVILQAIAGVFVIYSRMALTFLLLHSLFVTCYFGVLMLLLMYVLRKNEKSV